MLAFVFFYLGMLALGLSLEAMITLLTPKFIPYFVFTLACVLPPLQRYSSLIVNTQIIYNVAPTLLPPELLNNFYSYGTGFPIWYVYTFCSGIHKVGFDVSSAARFSLRNL